MSGKEFTGAAGLLFLIITMCCAAAFAIASSAGPSQLTLFQAEAVKRGYGEWLTDEKTSQPVFHWKEPEPEKK